MRPERMTLKFLSSKRLRIVHFSAPSMDILYSSSDSSSTPRTPSPHNIDMPAFWSPQFSSAATSTSQAANSPPSSCSTPASVPPPTSSRGSLLQELYDHDVSSDVYIENSLSPDWSQLHHHHHQQSHHNPSQHPPVTSQYHQQNHQIHPLRHDYPQRRATFPYVRRDHEDQLLQQYHHSPPFLTHDHSNTVLSYPHSRHEPIYGDSIPLSTDPSGLHSEPFIHSLGSSPHSSYHDFDHLDDAHPIKLEDAAPVIVPSQSPFFRNPSSPSCHPITMSYLSPHTGLPVQHTDDAASKETQYLRRRCFNCHTTEPPSWRRSTLNPGKIVCNKCGLYERTHLRPRPLRFDELRAGNKARKQSKTTLSPKSTKLAVVKKEPREFGLVRRSSVSSSSASSIRSGSGTSDWDDNVSVYSSSGSAPPTSYNSPNMAAYSLSRDSASQSPPLTHQPEGGIRLPNAPLSDIASLQQQQQHPSSPRKAASTPLPFFPASPEFFRRGSITEQSRDNSWAQGGPDDSVLAAAAAEERKNAVMVVRPTAVVS